MSPARILHAPTDVGGHAFQLSRAERELGLESDVVVFGGSELGYGADITVDVKGLSAPTRLARRLGFLRSAARRYDVFHFNFGQPLIALRRGGRVYTELPLLRRLGKQVLVTFQGCDVRPYERCFCGRETCRAETTWRGPNAEAMSRHADRVFFLNPDLREWLPSGRFLPYANVDIESVRPEPAPNEAELVIAHAPTDRAIKGTEDVIRAVEQLRDEGQSVRLDLIEGVRRDDVLGRLASADLVIDQLRLGWYGGFAVEAMALGRPVLCFIREEGPDDNPFGAELPIVRTSAATLAEDIRGLMVNPARRREIGTASRRFAEARHDPRLVAREALEGIVDLGPEPAGQLVGARPSA